MYKLDVMGSKLRIHTIVAIGLGKSSFELHEVQSTCSNHFSFFNLILYFRLQVRLIISMGAFKRW